MTDSLIPYALTLLFGLGLGSPRHWLMAGRLSPIARAPVVGPANSLIQNSKIVNESINRCFTKALDYSMRFLRQSKRR